MKQLSPSAFSDFIEAIATSVAVVSINDGRIVSVVSCNHQFCSMLGARKKDIVNRPLREYIPRYARKEFELHLRKCVDSSSPLEFIQPFDLYETTRWWRVTACPIMGDGKDPVSVLLTCIDVSDKIELENSLVIANSRLGSVIQSAYDGIVGVDGDQIITIFNSAAEDMFGYDADEIIGKPLSLLIPQRHHKNHETHFDKFHASPIRSRQMFERGGRITGVTRDGVEFPVEISISKIEVDGATEYTAVVRDISERARLIDQLQQQATVDELTGLINRRAFHERAAEHVELAHRHGNPLSLLMVDIDRFKSVNDTYGHAIGDLVLKAMAAGGTSTLRKSDFFARLGGEEFAILLPMTDVDEAEVLAERLRETVANGAFEFNWKGHDPVPFTISIGVTALRSDELSIENVMKRADIALYAAKDDGRNLVRVWRSEPLLPIGSGRMAA